MEATAQKMKFSIKDFFSKCDQNRSFLQTWSHLMKKSLMETSFLCSELCLIRLSRSKSLNFSSLRIYCRQSLCVKSVRIWSYSGPYFPAFGLNTERYAVSHRSQSECGKIRTRVTPNTDTFHAVSLSRCRC